MHPPLRRTTEPRPRTERTAMTRNHCCCRSWRPAGVLAFVVAACGGSDSELRRRRARQQRQTPAPQRSTGQEGRHADAARRRRRRLPRPGARPTTRSATMVTLRDPAAALLLQARTTSEPVPDLADGPPQISTDKKTVTVKIKQGRQVQPAGQPRGDLRGRQVRVRARSSPQRRRPVPRLLQLDRGRADEADDGRQADLRASRRPTTRRSSSS